MIRTIVATAVAALLALPAAAQEAPRDLATQPVALEPLLIGTGDNGYGVSVAEYVLEVGRAYRLPFEAVGFHECAFRAHEFFRNIWIRKLEAGGMEIKVAAIYELELDDDAEGELFFVTIRPGTYTWGCAGLEERGLTGRFVVR